MANCNVCGTFVQEGVKTCPNCGSPIASAVAAQAAQVVDTAAQAVDQTAAQAAQAVEGAVNTTAAQAAPVASSAPAFLGSMGAANGNMDAKNNKKLDAIANSLDGKDFTANYTAKDIEDNKLFAILAYFGILCLIPLFAAKESPYAKFHTNQGLLLLIIDAALSVVSIIFSFIPFVKSLIAPILFAVLLIFSATMFIYGLLNAIQDRAKELPGIGGIRIIK
jgi:uncharacterized membrane protein